MKRKLLTALLSGLLATSASFASVTINIGFGEMFSSPTETSYLPVGARINFLALESGSWSSMDLNSFFTNLTDSFEAPGVRLIGSWGNDDASGPGQTAGAINFIYSGDFNVGDELMMVVYAPLTLSDTEPGYGTPGFYFRSDAIVDGSSIAFVAPPDGGLWDMGAYTIGTTYGSYPDGQFTSGAGSMAANGSLPEGNFYGGGFTTVPEPSTYALLAMSALGMGGYMIRRRK